MDTKTETGLAVRVVSDVVEGLQTALSGWQEYRLRHWQKGCRLTLRRHRWPLPSIVRANSQYNSEGSNNLQ
jgi:hypothetical protein